MRDERADHPHALDAARIGRRAEASEDRAARDVDRDHVRLEVGGDERKRRATGGRREGADADHERAAAAARNSGLSMTSITACDAKRSGAKRPFRN